MYMMFKAIAQGSWKAPLIICFVIIAAGLGIQASLYHGAAEQELALKQGQPAPVSLDIFDRKSDVHAAKEVHVTARLNIDYNYRLIKEKNGRAEKTRYMYVFFGPSQAKTSRQARAAVILSEQDKDLFADLLMAQSEEKFAALSRGEIDGIPQADVFHLAGTRDLLPDLRSLADDAFDEQALTKGPDFIYVTPFLEGRTAALTPDYEFLGTWKYMWGSLLAFFALITFMKYLRRHAWQEKRDAQQAAKAFHKAHKTAAKTNFAPAAPQANTAPPAPTRTANTNPAANLLEWAQNHPVLAIAAGFFVLVIIVPGTALKLFPFLFAGGYMYLQFSAGQKLRSGIGSLFGQSAPAKGTLPNGQVLAPAAEAPEPPKYNVPPLATPKTEAPQYHIPPIEEPAPTPRPARASRRSVLNRNTQDSPIQRKQSLATRMGNLFGSKENTSDPFRRLNRG